MKKAINKVLMSSLLACVMFFTISLSGCIRTIFGPFIELEKFYNSLPVCGDFIYSIAEDDNGEKTAVLHGFSEEGRKKAGAVLPEAVDGYKVSLVGDGHWAPKNSEGVIRLYILSEFTFQFPNRLRNDDILKFNIYNSKFHDRYQPEQGGIGVNVYYPLNSKFFSAYETANLSYVYNYEDAPHEGTYWIDDYDGGTIKFIPPDPVREGYTFEGWYKDEECIEKWDFDNDLIPEKEYETKQKDDGTEYKVYKYKNNKLYAKWRKNA